MDINAMPVEKIEKACGKCGELKPIDEFHISRDKKDGHCSRCKKCVAAYHAEYCAEHREETRRRDAAYYVSHREKIRTDDAVYYAAHREKIRAHRAGRKEEIRAYRAAHREERHAYNLIKKYGLSHDAYNALFSLQQGKCAICGSDNGGKRLHTDHDHENGKVRGLLCSNCNHAIGLLHDDVELLNKAANYLKGARRK